MKIIHCSDLHLDADLRTRLDAGEAMQRRAELLDTFRRLCLYAREEGVSAILICGDLFDTDTPSSLAVRTVEDLILGNTRILFFYLRGNHDGGQVLFRTREKPDNLFLFGDDWTGWEVTLPDQTQRVCITGKEPSAAPFSPPDLDNSCFNIVMLHGQIREGYSGPDPESVPVSALRGRGIDYLAMGHLHHYSSFPLDTRGTGAYCGCLEGRGFDECGPCGFILIDTDLPAAESRIRFIPFALRRCCSVDCPVTGCTCDTEVYEQISRTLDECSAGEDDLVRLVLTGELEYGCSPDPAYIRRQWEDRYHYFETVNKTVPVIRIEEFLCDASLKGEFVRTVSAAEDLTDRERTRILRCGLRALSGESLF